MQDNRKLLREMGRKLERKRSLEKSVPKLEQELEVLKKNLREYRMMMKLEQWEADRMERISLTSLFHMLIGDREQELEREKREAAAAYIKFSTAEKEKQELEQQLKADKQELEQLKDCEAEYDRLVEEQLEALRGADSERARVLLKLEEKERKYEAQLKELDASLAAARSALTAANSILDGVDTAENISKGERFSQGNLDNIYKHHKLDEVQWEIVRLENGIRKMKAGPVDVPVSTDVSLQVERELRLAETLYDDKWSSSVVETRIEKTKRQALTVRQELVRGVAQIEAQRDNTQRKLEKQRQKIRSFVAE